MLASESQSVSKYTNEYLKAREHARVRDVSVGCPIAKPAENKGMHTLVTRFTAQETEYI